VGVVGYAVGGGIGWLSRKYGLAANSILAAEILTADGLHLRVDPTTSRPLLGDPRRGGVPGVITALELSLFPVDDVYAGTLMWPVERAAEVLERWAAWTATTPDEITSVGRIRHFPDAPRVPEAMRGRTLVVVEAAYLGPEDEGAALLAPLRELRPEIDTFATVPPVALGSLHMDPLGPSAGLTSTCSCRSCRPRRSTRRRARRAGSGSPLMSLELRQLGGALQRDPVEPGALGRLDAAFAVVAVGVPSAADGGAAVSAYLRRVVDRLAPWSEGRSYLNFAGRPTDARTAFDVDAFRRLAAVKASTTPTTCSVPVIGSGSPSALRRAAPPRQPVAGRHSAGPARGYSGRVPPADHSHHQAGRGRAGDERDAPDEVELWTDGACSGNPGPGGWAALLRWRGHERELSGGEPQTTNNRMELMGLIEGLRALQRPSHVAVHTDSSYIERAITDGWLRRWQANGWKTSARKDVANRDPLGGARRARRPP
jgi:ribonuclease HI